MPIKDSIERAASKRQYYFKNKERILEKNSVYRASHKEEIKIRKNNYYEANKHNILEKRSAYYGKNKEKCLAVCKEYRERDLEGDRAKQRERYANNREERIAKVHEYRKANIDKIREYDCNRHRVLNQDPDYRERKRIRGRKYYLENIKKEHIRSIKYSKNNPAKRRASDALRRSLKLNATPIWLTEEHKNQIEEIYKEAQQLSLTVDHVVPLKNKIVCGLHVPWNLQLLTLSENCQKSNKFAPEINLNTMK